MEGVVSGKFSIEEELPLKVEISKHSESAPKVRSAGGVSTSLILCRKL